MRSKTPLVLMEILVAVLVFALAAALCLKAFVLTDDLSELGETRDRAVLAAQSAAEVVKSCRGDWEQAAELLGGVWDGSILAVHTDNTFSLFVTPVESETPLLGTALVEAYSNGDDARLFELTVAWQEVDEHE